MIDESMIPRIYLVRHGETEWSRSGRHTGSTDIPLTAAGERQAGLLGEWLRAAAPAEVWCSPWRRARQTCEGAGIASNLVKIEPALREWEYGEYEGITTAQIQAHRPKWNVFEHGCPGGESPQDVSRRADGVVTRLRAMTGGSGPIAIFSHGHFLRALAARWIGLPVREGGRLLLQTASLSILACEHEDPEEPVIALWNAGVLGSPPDAALHRLNPSAA